MTKLNACSHWAQKTQFENITAVRTF